MADRFDMDLGESSLDSVARAVEEAARFDGIAPAAPPASVPPAAVPGALYRPGEPLADSIAALVGSDAPALSLAGCERLNTHVRSDVKKRIKVFCALHGLNLRHVCELAFEAVAAAMDEYDARGGV